MAMRKAAAPVPRKPTHQAPTHSGLSVVSSVLWGRGVGGQRPVHVHSGHPRRASICTLVHENLSRGFGEPPGGGGGDSLHSMEARTPSHTCPPRLFQLVARGS